MKKLFSFVILALTIAGCSKSSDDNTSEFSNKLQFGTGLNPSNLFELVNMGTVFPRSTQIYFRLESQDDMGGSDIMLQIKKSDGSVYNSFTYASIQSYGHIFLTAFVIPDAGNYTAYGILVTGNKTVASSPLTIQ